MGERIECDESEGIGPREMPIVWANKDRGKDPAVCYLAHMRGGQLRVGQTPGRDGRLGICGRVALRHAAYRPCEAFRCTVVAAARTPGYSVQKEKKKD